MLDQDTARALFPLADETGARVALVGDRHQLPAVGRGGGLDLATRWADPAACLTLDTIPRFVHTCVAPGGRFRTSSTRSSAWPCAAATTRTRCSMRCWPATRSGCTTATRHGRPRS